MVFHVCAMLLYLLLGLCEVQDTDSDVSSSRSGNSPNNCWGVLRGRKRRIRTNCFLNSTWKTLSCRELWSWEKWRADYFLRLKLQAFPFQMWVTAIATSGILLSSCFHKNAINYQQNLPLEGDARQEEASLTLTPLLQLSKFVAEIC